MTIFRSTSADFRSPPAGSTHKRISGGGKWKSTDVKLKTVTLIYPNLAGQKEDFYIFLLSQVRDKLKQIGLIAATILSNSIHRFTS
jgi:hypothetical protein